MKPKESQVSCSVTTVGLRQGLKGVSSSKWQLMPQIKKIWLINPQKIQIAYLEWVGSRNKGFLDVVCHKS